MINQLAPHGHQKMIFRHGPDDANPKILGLSDGPINLVNDKVVDVVIYKYNYTRTCYSFMFHLIKMSAALHAAVC